MIPLGGIPPDCLGAFWRPDSTLLLQRSPISSSTWKNIIELCDVRGNVIHQLSAPSTLLHAFTLEKQGYHHNQNSDMSPDGKYITFNMFREDNVRLVGVWDLTAGVSCRCIYKCHVANEAFVKWSPNSKRLLINYIGTGGPNCKVIDMTFMAEFRLRLDLARERIPFAWMADSTRFIHGEPTADRDIRYVRPVIVNLTGCKLWSDDVADAFIMANTPTITPFAFHKTSESPGDSRVINKHIAGVACSPDGRYIACTSWDYDLYLWDATTFDLISSQCMRDEVETEDNTVVPCMNLRWSPDSRLLAVSQTATNDIGFDDVGLVRPSTLFPRVNTQIWQVEETNFNCVSRMLGNYRDPEWSPDMRQLLTTNVPHLSYCVWNNIWSDRVHQLYVIDPGLRERVFDLMCVHNHCRIPLEVWLMIVSLCVHETLFFDSILNYFEYRSRLGKGDAHEVE